MTESGEAAPDDGTRRIDEDELLAELRRVTGTLGRRPTTEEFDERGSYSTSTYYRRFGSWQQALEAAGVADEYDGPPAEHLSEGELLDEIDRMAEVLGRPPTTGEMDELGAHSSSTYRRRFGSWQDAVRAAGYAGETVSAGEKCRISERELVAELRRLNDEYGRPPTYEEMQDDGRYAGATYLARFGSWNEAVAAAELDPRPFRGDGIPTRELIRKLRALAVELGRRPYRKDMDETGPHSGMTYYDRFGGWRQALDAAGIQRTDDGTAIVGRCDLCASSVRRPVTELPDGGGLACGERCRSALDRPPIFFETEVIGREEDALGRITAVLHESDVPVARVLFALRYAIEFVDAEFRSARFDGGTIAADGDRLRVSVDDSEFELVVERETVDAVTTHIESVSSSARSPEALRSADKSDVSL